MFDCLKFYPTLMLGVDIRFGLTSQFCYISPLPWKLACVYVSLHQVVFNTCVRSVWMYISLNIKVTQSCCQLSHGAPSFDPESLFSNAVLASLLVSHDLASLQQQSWLHIMTLWWHWVTAHVALNNTARQYRRCDRTTMCRLEDDCICRTGAKLKIWRWCPTAS